MRQKEIKHWVDKHTDAHKAGSSSSSERGTRERQPLAAPMQSSSNQSTAVGDDGIPLGGTAADVKDRVADIDKYDFGYGCGGGSPPPPSDYDPAQWDRDSDVRSIEQDHFRLTGIAQSRRPLKPKAIGGTQMTATLALPVTDYGHGKMERNAMMAFDVGVQTVESEFFFPRPCIEFGMLTCQLCKCFMLYSATYHV